MREQAKESAALESEADERSRVVGSLVFSTVGSLLPVGSEAIANGRAALIDLAGVTDGDSSGLALLIEWKSVAKYARRTLRYEHLPSQLLQLARLSEVDELLTAE